MSLRKTLVPALSTLALLWSGCGGCSAPPAGPCDDDDGPDGCGDECGNGSPCPAGLYCGPDGTCTAECTTDDECDAGQRCNGVGLCIDLLGSGQDGGPGDGGLGDGSRLDGAFDDSNVCADIDVTARVVTPTVMLVIDQSSSMNARFSSSGSRWDVLRDSLLDSPGGFVSDLESQVRFGLALYSARSEDGDRGGPPIGDCPMLETVEPALDNYDAIAAVYEPADVVEDTPTGDALDAVIDLYFAAPDDEDPVVFVLATDGEPDRCEELDPQNGQAEAVAAAERAYALGIRTYIISVGEGTVSEEHLQDMANAGVGGGPDAPFWVAGDDEGLRDALRSIIGGELSCELELNGRMVLDIACDGRVVLNGRPLACEDPNGWAPIDETHIEILGDACDELLSTARASLQASFPCDAVILI